MSCSRPLPTTTSPKSEKRRRLLEQGREGGYIFAPSHAVESDVPLTNILAFLDEARSARQ